MPHTTAHWGGWARLTSLSICRSRSYTCAHSSLHALLEGDGEESESENESYDSESVSSAGHAPIKAPKVKVLSDFEMLLAEHARSDKKALWEIRAIATAAAPAPAPAREEEDSREGREVVRQAETAKSPIKPPRRLLPADVDHDSDEDAGATEYGAGDGGHYDKPRKLLLAEVDHDSDDEGGEVDNLKHRRTYDYDCDKPPDPPGVSNAENASKKKPQKIPVSRAEAEDVDSDGGDADVDLMLFVLLLKTVSLSKHCLLLCFCTRVIIVTRQYKNNMNQLSFLSVSAKLG